MARSEDKSNLVNGRLRPEAPTLQLTLPRSRVNTQAQSSSNGQRSSCVPTLDLGVNDNDPVMDNVSGEPEKFINKEANPEAVEGTVSQALLRFLHQVARGQSNIGCHKSITERLPNCLWKYQHPK
ncbi:hypothetical protein J1N35_007480 [Gossypium stocksii]|uniref:Uncharacterized protein n=1 Tax=Gossypium stocksii TaxID=47602 RepID=A0A9D4ADI9_9ROSI|nr:hypothetical protein J1N35_007480 [Gossypium stocksii]